MWLTGKGMTHGLRQRAWPLGEAHRALLLQLAEVGVIQRLAWPRSGSGSTVEYQVIDAECMKFLEVAGANSTSTLRRTSNRRALARL